MSIKLINLAYLDFVLYIDSIAPDVDAGHPLGGGLADDEPVGITVTAKSLRQLRAALADADTQVVTLDAKAIADRLGEALQELGDDNPIVSGMVCGVLDEINESIDHKQPRQLTDNENPLVRLAESYRCDCQNRIDLLNEELNAEPMCWNPDDPAADDIRDQIGHWEQTLKMIDDTLARVAAMEGSE